ncbi:MAG TPA: DUF6186 family protein [Acidimicrobiia bacterium]|jgi:hypothetical protein|nr:DUF6186 family protein [Acidimicrobiia bacterium]
MSRAVTLWGYAVLAVAGVAYQVAGVVLGRTATLGQALSRVTKVRAGRFLLLAGWLWAGWHTFVRRG